MYSLVIVEDEKTEREALVRIAPWKELGFCVEQSFRDGSECIDYLHTSTPDVILTDIMMLRKSGLDIAKYVHMNKLATQVVLLSGYKEFEYAQQAVECGVSFYLVKPISLPKLREVFTKIAEKIEAQRMLELERRKQNHRNFEQHKVKYGSSVDKVLQYIDEHFKENLSLNTLAENLFLNPGYISRMLKEQTGKNFTDIVNEKRIEQSIWLLENTNMYVYEIAVQTGYKNLKYFYRVFRKVTGKAPNDYREEVNNVED